jgi:hypothetical protein
MSTVERDLPAPGPPRTKTTVTRLWSKAGCSGVERSEGGGLVAKPVSLGAAEWVLSSLWKTPLILSMTGVMVYEGMC